MEFKLPFKAGGIAGAWGVGKTLACLDLLVLAKKAGVPQEELLVIDTHGSVEPYLLLEGYQNVFTYEQCLDGDVLLGTIAKAQKGGKKRILVVDTIEPLQDRVVADVWEDPALTDAYKEKAISFMWGRAKKNLLRQLLGMMVGLAATSLFTIHTRKEFVGKTPTGREETKFLAPVMQLCQFVAVLSRRPNQKLPDASFFPPMGKSQFPALPPAIQEFTWAKFLRYVGEAPANWAALKKGETVTEGLELLEKLNRGTVVEE